MLSLTLALSVGAVQASTTATGPLINFDQIIGPSTGPFNQSPPLTIGLATFSGGLVMTNLVNLIADTSSVYGTFSFCCAGVITINFARAVSNVSVRVLNGDNQLVDYVVSTNRGDSITKTLIESFNGGQDTFTLSGSGITTVTVRPTIIGGFADFQIDDVSFGDRRKA
jgi:hypothetical protein